ncbi:hypothetical protein C0991_003607 [Blastosporella zonata]|nr:hypothetical protein C0991_003607 [Blastosporella zonata]
MGLVRLHGIIASILGLVMAAQWQQTLVTAALPSSAPAGYDPYADPKNDPHNPLKYITTNSLTAVSFSLIILVAISQTYCMIKWGAKWMLSLVIGEYCFAFGLALRFGLHMHPDSLNLYIVQDMFVVLSPCAFIAADYVLLGRIAAHHGLGKHLLIPARKITRAFVISDISTFLIQAAGGGLSASAKSLTLNKTGSRIFLVGLILQLVSFATFIAIYGIFLYRVRTQNPEVWTRDMHKPWHNDWRTLSNVLCISCLGILIRSFYRVIELSQGYGGHLATTESFFYGLDTLPLFLAISLYTPFWPGRFINGDRSEHQEIEMKQENGADSI